MSLVGRYMGLLIGTFAVALGVSAAEAQSDASAPTGVAAMKNGYLHPAQPVDKRMLVDLGVSDEAFVKALYAALKPGGRVLIYNLSPAPSPPGQPYKPWSDGRCPFPRSLWESAGLKVRAFDANDDTAARAMGRALGWDKGPSAMDLDRDLFALYTLVERP